MKDSTLVKLFSALDKADLRTLKKVVRSPFFNHREDVIALFDYLAANMSRPEAWLHRERVFAHIFKGAPFDMQEMRYVMSFLINIIKEYLAFEEIKSDQALIKLHLVKALKRRGAVNLIEKITEEAIEEHNLLELRDSHYYLTQYKLFNEEYQMVSRSAFSSQFDPDPLFKSWTAFQLIECLKVGCMGISLRNFSKKEYPVPLLKDVLVAIETGQYSDNPTISVWYHTYKCLEKTDGDAHFIALKQLIAQQYRRFPPFEIGDIYLSAINFCIWRLNRGEKQYLAEIFELYNSGFDNKALLPNGILSKYTYNNAMICALRLEKHEWIQQFLEKYKDFLPESERENTYSYNMAFYLYQTRNYGEALDLLQKVVNFSDPLYNLDARRMLVRIFYETHAFSALTAQLDSYKAYLRRHKEIGYHREHHLNFISLVQRMISSNLSLKSERQKLLKKVESETAIAEKDWLIQQLSQN